MAKVWDAQTGTQLLEYTGHADAVRYMLSGFLMLSQVRCVRVARFEYLDIVISSSNDFTIHAWNIETGQQLCTFDGHEGVRCTTYFFLTR